MTAKFKIGLNVKIEVMMELTESEGQSIEYVRQLKSKKVLAVECFAHLKRWTNRYCS